MKERVSPTGRLFFDYFLFQTLRISLNQKGYKGYEIIGYFITFYTLFNLPEGLTFFNMQCY